MSTTTTTNIQTCQTAKIIENCHKTAISNDEIEPQTCRSQELSRFFFSTCFYKEVRTFDENALQSRIATRTQSQPRQRSILWMQEKTLKCQASSERMRRRVWDSGDVVIVATVEYSHVNDRSRHDNQNLTLRRMPFIYTKFCSCWNYGQFRLYFCYDLKENKLQLLSTL